MTGCGCSIATYYGTKPSAWGQCYKWALCHQSKAVRHQLYVQLNEQFPLSQSFVRKFQLRKGMAEQVTVDKATLVNTRLNAF